MHGWGDSVHAESARSTSSSPIGFYGNDLILVLPAARADRKPNHEPRAAVAPVCGTSRSGIVGGDGRGVGVLMGLLATCGVAKSEMGKRATGRIVGYGTSVPDDGTVMTASTASERSSILPLGGDASIFGADGRSVQLENCGRRRRGRWRGAWTTSVVVPASNHELKR